MIRAIRPATESSPGAIVLESRNHPEARGRALGHRRVRLWRGRKSTMGRWHPRARAYRVAREVAALAAQTVFPEDLCELRQFPYWRTNHRYRSALDRRDGHENPVRARQARDCALWGRGRSPISWRT